MERSRPRSRPVIGFDGLYGLELIELTEELARGRVRVREELKRLDGSVHGGVHAAIAESLATAATASAVAENVREVSALSSQTNFLRPIRDGVIDARARARRAGRGIWVWDVEILDEHGRLCSVVRMIVAARGSAASPTS
jgi:uncharacterized protein (TIGR00369 family)